MALATVLGSEQQLPAAIVSTALTFGLFPLTHRALRRWVDRQIYGIRINYNRPQTAVTADRSYDQVAGYQVIGSIGRGGMADVYLAQRTEAEPHVAIKVLHDRSEEVRQRFDREARTIAGLAHPNIVKVLSYGTEKDVPYMVMEYINGDTLEARIKRDNGLSIRDAAVIIKALASALAYAHTHDVVHRDLKAANVLMRGRTPILTDFGVAKIIGGTAVTTQNQVLGTLHYMAPEQIRGETVDRRADIYALGVLSFYMVTGRLPFDSDSPGAILLAHLQRPVPDPRDSVPELHAEAVVAILRAMAKAPDERYDNAEAFAEAFA